ncbi:MAG: transposase [Gammaproteobacteria bacterium]
MSWSPPSNGSSRRSWPKTQRSKSAAGVGPLISIALAQRFDRIAYPNSDAAVAAYGLDPRPKESGKFTGKRKLSKRGNPEERRLVYLAAVSGARTRAWQPYFANLAKGLSKTAAYCALARKSSAWPSLSGTPTPPSTQHCSEKRLTTQHRIYAVRSPFPTDAVGAPAASLHSLSLERGEVAADRLRSYQRIIHPTGASSSFRP